MRDMMFARFILGGLAGVVLALAAAADVPNIQQRPFSRTDADALRIAHEREVLAAFRAVPRPAYMIRYPVVIETEPATMRPVARSNYLPQTRWDFRPDSHVWTRAAMRAVASHQNGLDSLVPRDIEAWCPAYEENSAELRRAFWVGMMSALTKHESTYNPRAVGGGGRWFGLLQILPATARGYGCRAQTGEALKNPADNLSCAARIMTFTVARDNAVAVYSGRWRGVAADWGPMANRAKIAEMSAWTRAQDYCRPVLNMRPQARPDTFVGRVSTMTVVGEN